MICTRPGLAVVEGVVSIGLESRCLECVRAGNGLASARGVHTNHGWYCGQGDACKKQYQNQRRPLWETWHMWQHRCRASRHRRRPGRKIGRSLGRKSEGASPRAHNLVACRCRWRRRWQSHGAEAGKKRKAGAGAIDRSTETTTMGITTVKTLHSCRLSHGGPLWRGTAGVHRGKAGGPRRSRNAGRRWRVVRWCEAERGRGAEGVGWHVTPRDQLVRRHPRNSIHDNATSTTNHGVRRRRW